MMIIIITITKTTGTVIVFLLVSNDTSEETLFTLRR